MFVHNSAIAVESFKTREPGDVDISRGRQGSQDASVTRPVPREDGQAVNEGRQAEYSSLGTVLLVDSDSGRLSTRAYLLSACKVAVTSVAGYAEIPSAQPASYDIVAISKKAGFAEVRSTAVYVRKAWPDTKILLLEKFMLDLDDPLYDDIVDPAFQPAALDRSVLQLLALCAYRRAD